jgi:hypothetical protein
MYLKDPSGNNIQFMSILDEKHYFDKDKNKL